MLDRCSTGQCHTCLLYQGWRKNSMSGSTESSRASFGVRQALQALHKYKTRLPECNEVNKLFHPMSDNFSRAWTCSKTKTMLPEKKPLMAAENVADNVACWISCFVGGCSGLHFAHRAKDVVVPYYQCQRLGTLADLQKNCIVLIHRPCMLQELFICPQVLLLSFTVTMWVEGQLPETTPDWLVIGTPGSFPTMLSVYFMSYCSCKATKLHL